MILVFESIEEVKDKISRQGKRYDCWIVRGKKKGFEGAPDMPYEKTIFPTDTITVLEQGISRPGCSLLQFLQKACKPGDSLTIKSERDGKFWRWANIQKYEGRGGFGGDLPTYEPLPVGHSASDALLPPTWND